MDRRRPTRRGPLTAAELAEAVVLADLSLALTVVGQVVPLGGALLAAAVVPLAVIAARHRLRAVVAGALAAGAVGFLVVGTAALTTMGGCAAMGAVVGAAERRGWSTRRTLAAATALVWPPAALLADGALAAFANTRRLTLEQVRNSWKGLFHLLRNLGLQRVGAPGDHAITWITREWWLSIPIALLGATVIGTLVAIGLARPTLRRVRAAFGDAQAEPADPGEADTGSPEPLPIALREVSYRYPGASFDALHDVSADIRAHEMVVVVGANGSGKSTLARLVAGRNEPTAGTIDRAGAVGLGRAGGTAMVFQRPEAQVLGVRVRDDVVWGLPRDHGADVDGVLARVGLDALADRETSTLSGGELQRLALAAALARNPRLLVSDESTAMVDAPGRQRIVALLHDLAATDGIGVVHVSHHATDAAAADRTIALAHGRLVDRAAVRVTKSEPVHEHRAVDRAPRVPHARPMIELRDVGHVYSRRTPWAMRALTGVDLDVDEGESVLVVGHNGSGKSTLAWIVAGLIVPSEGEALLDGRPIGDTVGRVGLSFQHARLQLLRPTVLDDVRGAAGVDERAARAALEAVGLDAGALGDRRVDQLSGGQMRRAVLAGVLASRPRAIVLDEPFAGLDVDGRDELHTVLLGLRRTGRVALVLVSHDDDLPDDLHDRLVELDGGRVVRDVSAGNSAGRGDDPIDEVRA